MGETTSPHIAGLVLARGGSKGIPLKNLAPLGSRPLLTWCLQASQEFGKFDSIWVSTDHGGIAECAQACGAKVVLVGDNNTHKFYIYRSLFRFSIENQRMPGTVPAVLALFRSSWNPTRKWTLFASFRSLFYSLS